jgi:predicted polyphosphate/ATP-dependent NAD kinase
VVNPVAGMGGRVGLKGTDGPGVLAEARRRGAVPLAPDRVGLFLARLGTAAREVRWLTASGAMGADLLVAAGLAEGRDLEVVHTAGAETTAKDTRATCSAAIARGAGAIVFCGGDGTARDVLAAVGGRCPVLGVPVGVKMFSGVFALSPKAAADVLHLYLGGHAEEGEGEVADVDEEAYRKGELRVHLHGMLRILRAPMLIQSMKSASIVPEEGDYQEAIAKYVFELVLEQEGTMAILGAGTTVEAIAEVLGVPKTPLGVDAYLMGKVVVADASEADLLAALGRHKGRAIIVVSPIGAQGFVLGRGTQQISPAVVAAAGGPDNVLVVGTPHKLAGIATLRVDTGDAGLDAELSGWRRIIVGYHEMRMMRIEPAAGPSP